GAAGPLDHLRGDALHVVEGEVQVGVRCHLRVGGRERVGEGRDQSRIGLRVEQVLHAALVAARLAIDVVASVLGVDDGASPGLYDGHLHVAEVAVGLDPVVVGVLDGADRGPGPAVHLAAQGDGGDVARVGAAAEVGVQVRLGGGHAPDGGGPLDLG